jgi:hypothetical protein
MPGLVNDFDVAWGAFLAERCSTDHKFIQTGLFDSARTPAFIGKSVANRFVVCFQKM